MGGFKLVKWSDALTTTTRPMRDPLPGQNLLVACLLILLSAACSRETPPANPDRDRGTPVAAMTLTERDLSRRVTVSAPVQPRVHIRLASRAGGRVNAVYKEEGDAVESGELLAELDMSEQRAELRRARAEEERARTHYERMEALRQRENVSLSEFQSARAELRVAESERELWQTRVSFGRIEAPRQAVVTQRLIEPGEAVQEQDVLFELSDLGQLVVQPGLSELDVVHLTPGQTLPVRLDALPGLELEGSVSRIFPSADPASRLVTIEVALPENAARRGVKPGFLARLAFEVNRQEDVLALPSSIVGSDDERGGRYVYVIKDDVLEHRPVTTGVTQDGWTEITDGVERGETVLASNPIDMRDGQKVYIVQRRDDA